MALVAVDKGYPRSPRGAVKIARTLVALVTFICFAASRSHEAYTALAAMEAAITALLFVLNLLQLDRKMSWFFWPLADVLNSVIAALFLVVVCLLAISIKTNNGTLAGGVLGLILLVLCVVDAVLIFRKISLDEPRSTTAAK
ncbi:chemokine-like factor [Apus apus]|uniref:chemokine-like factor n=1 Tax=Apus apus TaxID=8895 RepID=UPI0021F8F9AF|nr:chemokine-like factor [Apus apus]